MRHLCATPLEAGLITKAPLRLRRPAPDESLREAFNACCLYVAARSTVAGDCFRDARAMLHRVMVQLAVFAFNSRVPYLPYYAGVGGPDDRSDRGSGCNVGCRTVLP